MTIQTPKKKAAKRQTKSTEASIELAFADENYALFSNQLHPDDNALKAYKTLSRVRGRLIEIRKWYDAMCSMAKDSSSILDGTWDEHAAEIIKRWRKLNKKRRENQAINRAKRNDVLANGPTAETWEDFVSGGSTAADDDNEDEDIFDGEAEA